MQRSRTLRRSWRLVSSRLVSSIPVSSGLASSRIHDRLVVVVLVVAAIVVVVSIVIVIVVVAVVVVEPCDAKVKDVEWVVACRQTSPPNVICLAIDDAKTGGQPNLGVP